MLKRDYLNGSDGRGQGSSLVLDSNQFPKHERATLVFLYYYTSEKMFSHTQIYAFPDHARNPEIFHLLVTVVFPVAPGVMPK